MRSGLEQQNLIDALLLLCPESVGLQWDLAVSFQQQGRELVEQNEYGEAVKKFRTCLEKKFSLLEFFRDNFEQWDTRRLDIMETCLYVAELQKSLDLPLEVYKTLSIFYKVFEKNTFAEPYKQKSLSLLSKSQYLFPTFSELCENNDTVR